MWTLFQSNWHVFIQHSVWLPLSVGWGGGQAVLAGLSCPPPRPVIGSNSVISQFLLHHNLGIFSCMRYKHYFGQTEMFASNVQFGYPCPRGGGQAVQAGLSCPPAQDLSQAVSSVNSYCTITLEYLVVRDVNIISVKLRCLHLTFSSVILVRGVGGKLSRLVYLASTPRIWVRQCHQSILIAP